MEELTITINGTDYTLSTLLDVKSRAALVLPIRLAEAEREQIQADAHYRAWRAKETLTRAAKKDKPPEWKVRAGIESSDGFLRLKEAIAQAQYNVTLLRGLLGGES